MKLQEDLFGGAVESERELIQRSRTIAAMSKGLVETAKRYEGYFDLVETLDRIIALNGKLDPNIWDGLNRMGADLSEGDHIIMAEIEEISNDPTAYSPVIPGYLGWGPDEKCRNRFVQSELNRLDQYKNDCYNLAFRCRLHIAELKTRLRKLLSIGELHPEIISIEEAQQGLRFKVDRFQEAS